MKYAFWPLIHDLSILRLTLMSQATDDIGNLWKRVFQVFVAQWKERQTFST
jgi:hypothetical protein